MYVATPVRLGRRHVRAPADAGTGLEEPQRTSYGGLYRPLRGPAITEAYFGFGGMHIHIHVVAGYMQLQHEGRPDTGRQRRAIRGLRRAHDTVVAHHAPVDDQEHASRGGPDIRRAFDESGDMDGPLHIVNVDEALHITMAPQLRQPGAERGDHGQLERQLSVVPHGEVHVAPEHPDGLHRVKDAAPFGARALEEFLPGGGVVEQPLDRHGGAASARRVTRVDHGAGGRPHLCSRAIIRRRFDHELRDGGDGGKRFAAKPEAAHTDQLFSGRDFRGGVSGEREHGVVAVHTTSIVGDADEGAPTVFDGHIHRGRARIKRIFDQLLDHRCRTFNDFAGRNLIGDSTGQDGDARHV